MKKQAGTFSDLNASYSIYLDKRDRSFMPTSGYTSVTFYEKELNENEEKRSIKVINPSLMGRVIDEFERLI